MLVEFLLSSFISTFAGRGAGTDAAMHLALEASLATIVLTSISLTWTCLVHGVLTAARKRFFAVCLAVPGLRMWVG